MLILILINVKFLQNVVFSLGKGSNDPNHSSHCTKNEEIRNRKVHFCAVSLDSHRPIKNFSPSKISHFPPPPPGGNFDER